MLENPAIFFIEEAANRLSNESDPSPRQQKPHQKCDDRIDPMNVGDRDENEANCNARTRPKVREDVVTAGFERGTGVLINIVPPEVAAARLRSVAISA